MISETLCVPSVFLDKEQATSLISRQKRNTPSTLEQACMEKVCSYEEARKFFQDTYRTVSPLLIPSSFPQTSFAPLFVKRATVQLQMFTYAVLFLLQDIFWSVYVGKCIIKRIVHYCLCISTALQLINFSVFRWRSVRREALQEWSHVFRQRWRL